MTAEMIEEKTERERAWKAPYSIRTTSKASKPGCWNVNDVDVLGPDGSVIGSYNYNYSNKPPFFPFEFKDKWYALYSKDYTASRIMKLPSCEDVWGQDRDTWGFCPVQFYVPAIQNINFGGDRTGKFAGIFERDGENFQEPHYDQEHDWTVCPVEFYPFGFVCGCVWGDDSSWKVQFFDFSKLDEGIVVYDARFGYVELHDKLSLAESILIYGGHTLDQVRIQITSPQTFKFSGSVDKDE